MAVFKRSNPSDLKEKLSTLTSKDSFNKVDDKEWKPTIDKAGNCEAVIRFLPSRDEDSLPIIKMINHGFKKNGEWYIEPCTATHGDFDSCPVCEYMKKEDLYNTNEKEFFDIGRKTGYWANVLVVKDQAHPENDGKVFKYRFGKKIFDKINAESDVNEDLGEVPVDVTCVYEGANFLLKVKKVKGFSNYDDSKFLKQTAIPNIDDDKVANALIEGMSDLNEIIAKDKFKSYDENNKKFIKMMGLDVNSKASAEADAIEDQLANFDKDMDDYNSKAKSDDDDLDDVFTGESTTSTSTDDFDLDSLLDD